MKQMALGLITFYRRFLSPYKGFSCAYRLHRGSSSCSSFGYQAITRWGLLAGIQLLRRRLRKCGLAHRKAMAQLTPREINQRHRRAQAGFCDAPIGCDLPAGGCDLPDPGGHSCLSDLNNIGDCGWGCDGCDFPYRRTKTKDEDQS